MTTSHLDLPTLLHNKPVDIFLYQELLDELLPLTLKLDNILTKNTVPPLYSRGAQRNVHRKCLLPNFREMEGAYDNQKYS